MPLVALVEAIAAKQPTLLCVQDLHWADPSTLGLLRRLPPLVSAPVLIVVNYRPRILPGIREERIIVDDLTDDQVSTMLREPLDGTLRTPSSTWSPLALVALGVDRGVAFVRDYIPRLLPDVLDGTIQPGKVFDIEPPVLGSAFAYRAMDKRRAIKVLLRP
jgi:hypothetical protein